jgi:hypothetical protein
MKKSTWLGVVVIVIFIAFVIGFFVFMEMVFNNLLK